MSKDIYTIQRTLNEILDIEGDYTIPDAELFDCSDYPDDGKCSGRFDWTGKTFSEDHCSNLSIAHQGQVSHNKGNKFSKETREKMRVSSTGKTHTSETKERMRQAKLGKKRGPYKKSLKTI